MLTHSTIRFVLFVKLSTNTTLRSYNYLTNRLKALFNSAQGNALGKKNKMFLRTESPVFSALHIII